MIIDVHTDGSCFENPGPAGWGFIINTGDTEIEKYGPTVDRIGVPVPVTNQYAELMAYLIALKYVTKMNEERPDITVIRLHSDSAYLLNCLKDKWYINWRLSADDKGIWYTKSGTKVVNQWIWQTIIAYQDRLIKDGISFEYIKIKGHTGDHYNERADKLAKMGTEMSKGIFADPDGVSTFLKVNKEEN